MLAAERQRQILDRVRRDGTARTVELAKDLNVTEETIRRDLDQLGRLGHVRRTHGGAMDASGPFDELSQSERSGRQLAEKVAIAREAVKWIGPGESLLLDASTTVQELAGLLPEGMPLRVVTYSQTLIERLAGRGDLELVQLGGSYDARGRRFSGILTESALRLLKIDRFFFSGAGFDLAQGISEPNPEEARLKRLILSQAAWSGALLDHTKLGVMANHFFAGPGELDVIFTDGASKDQLPEPLEDFPCEWVFAR